MATLTTKEDIRERGSQFSKVWKSITLNSGDILNTGNLEVWNVSIQDSTKWATPGWTVGTGANRGKITFTLTGTFTGRLVVFGR